MTYAQELRRDGALNTRRETLVRLLKRRFGLTEAERELILACEDEDALDVALDAILDADSKGQVLGKLA